jgi:hypothetical protein
MLRLCHQLQRANTKISLKHTAINSLHQTYIVVTSVVQILFVTSVVHVLAIDVESTGSQNPKGKALDVNTGGPHYLARYQSFGPSGDEP